MNGGVPIENAAGGVGADHECPDPVHLQLQQGRDLKYILYIFFVSNINKFIFSMTYTRIPSNTYP